MEIDGVLRPVNFTFYAMRYLLILLALLLANSPAGAQVLRPAARPDLLTLPLATAPAAPDTVAALHRLFAAKRLSMRVAMPFLMTVGAGLLSAGFQPQNSINPIGALNGLTGLVIGFTAIASTAASFTNWMKYSKKHEAETLKAFEERQLPATWQHELKPYYFRPTKAIP